MWIVFLGMVDSANTIVKKVTFTFRVDVKKLIKLCWLIRHGRSVLTPNYVLTQSKHNQINLKAYKKQI